MSFTGMGRALERRPVAAVAIAAAVSWAVALGGIALVRYGGDPRGFLCLGELVSHPAALDGAPMESPHGYDGQYYAALATDPLLLRPDTPRFLDAPAYRATRILVPAAAYVLALGNGRVAIHAYLWLCWALGIAAVGIVATWQQAGGRAHWWATALIVSGGLVISMVRATPDAAALALLLAALALQRRDRTAWAVVALSAAVLARETSLLALPALAWYELRRKHTGGAVALLGVPLAAFLAWQARLWSLFGVHSQGVGNFSLPFRWLPGKLANIVGPGGDVNWMEVCGLAAIAVSLAAAVVLVARPKKLGPVEATYVAFAALALFLNQKIYGEAYSYARVLIALPFLAAIAAGQTQRPLRRRLFLGVIVTFALLGIVALRGELRSYHLRAAWDRLRAPAVQAAPPTAASPAVAPTPVPAAPTTPAQESTLPPLVLLPVARINGNDGARWRTELVIENLSRAVATLRLELLLAGKDNSAPKVKTISLEAGGRLVSEDALGELFGCDGAGALRVRAEGGAVKARLRTYDAARKAPRGHFLDSRPETAGFRAGRPAVLRGLVNDTDATTRKRTNLGMLNLTAIAIEVEVTLRDERGGTLGARGLRLGPWEFRQVNDVFAELGATEATSGSASVVTTTPGGSLLAYAAVVRRQPAGVTYVTP